MTPDPIDFSTSQLVERAIKSNWENFHYCLSRSPTVELSIGRYLTWFVTNVPDHFLNLVVCTDLQAQGMDELIEDALAHFRSLHVQKISWLAREGTLSQDVRKSLESHGFTFNESGFEMAADLTSLPEAPHLPAGLEIRQVLTGQELRQWIHVASTGFGLSREWEPVWYDFFTLAACEMPFRTYLAFLDGRPVGTSQLFTSAGVAGIYNVTCLPEARRRGIGAAVTHAALLDASAMEYRVAILQASQLGHPVYRRLGFQDFGRLGIYQWEDRAGFIPPVLTVTSQ
jgi:GNAT superfamily N-acetyltransferase